MALKIKDNLFFLSTFDFFVPGTDEKKIRCKFGHIHWTCIYFSMPFSDFFILINELLEFKKNMITEARELQMIFGHP